MPTNGTAGETSMKSAKVIVLDRSASLMRKTGKYLADMEAFFADSEKGITILLDTLVYADDALILKMLPLLGCAGKDRALWPLFHLMTKPFVNESVRRAAAVQLSVAASLSNDPSALNAALTKTLNHSDPAIRGSCALALGWEGNRSAVPSLMLRLQDSDRDVQAVVVTALASVGDDRVLTALIARMECGAMEERRSILLNLWRFSEQARRVEETYLKWLDRLSEDLRLDALYALGMLPFSEAICNAYRHLLKDADPRVRRQVIDNLSATGEKDYAPLVDSLNDLLRDGDRNMRQAVIRLFARR
jgi:HEAT repeat protein